VIAQVKDVKRRTRFANACRGLPVLDALLPLDCALFRKSQPWRFYAGPALALEVGDEVICIKKRILADTTPVIYSIDYLPRSLFGNRDYTRIDLTGDIFEILEQECHQQISSNVAHLKASCGDEAIRAAMRLAPGEAMLLLDEVCFNRLCRPVMRSLSYYTNFFDFSILRKLL